MSRRTVIISGGAGFIGTQVARLLLDDGHTVVVLDNLHPQVHPSGEWPKELDPRARRIQGSVDDLSAWTAVLEAASDPAPAILHLAAETGTGQSLTEARRHASVNVLGTATMTDALVQQTIRPSRIVLTSSRAVYGEGLWLDGDGEPGYPGARTKADLELGRWEPRLGGEPASSPIAHDAATVAPRPTNIYASTKLAQEHLLSNWCTAMEVPFSVLRLQNVYGAGQALTNSYTGVLTFFARLALAGNAIPVYEGGEILRDFVHVSDVATALVSALTAESHSDLTVDIGSGAPITLLETAQMLAELAGAPVPVVTQQYRLGDVRAAFASIDAARAAIGYHPAMSLRDGLSELLAYAAEG